MRTEDRFYEIQYENEDLREQLMLLKREEKVAEPLAKAIAEFADWHQIQASGNGSWSLPMAQKISRSLWDRVSEEAKRVLGFSVPYPVPLKKE
tara:strand:+ start:4751 stop:5029 length:279 start_codon:yes stop_codon:yes gene_type:complete